LIDLGRISDAVQRFIDRLRGTTNAAPVDAAQEKKPSPIEKIPTTAKIKPRDWKMHDAFKARPRAPMNSGHRKMIKH